MLPTTLVNSGSQGNGVLSPRDAARHTAGAKRYKYLRRLFHFRQMDFEFALWQMLYLFTSPQRVYRNFHYRKQTKDQWARDDPAFLVLLSIWLCGECRRTDSVRKRGIGKKKEVAARTGRKETLELDSDFLGMSSARLADAKRVRCPFLS